MTSMHRPAARSRLLFQGLGVALLALVSAGCEARLLVDVAVEDDGSGVLAVSLGADAELLALAREAGADPLGDLAEAGAGIAQAGWVTNAESTADGGMVVTLSAPFTDAAEFNLLAEDLTAALDAPEVTLLDGLALAMEEDLIRLDGTASLEPTAVVADLGLQPEQAIALLAEQEALTYEVAVTLPGEVRQTTASVGGADGEPLRWTIVPGQTVEISAVGERPGVPALVWGGLAAAGGFAAATFVLLRARQTDPDRRGRHAA